MTKTYAIVTAISTHRMRYAIPLDGQDWIHEWDGNVDTAALYAKDSVIMEEVKEFSQEHLGEQIVDSFVYDEDEMLKLFDTDNDYLKSWTREQKLNYVNDWKEKL